MKKIIVIGAGESGFGAAMLAKAKGCDVLVSDNNEIDIKFKTKLKEQHIRYEESGHSEHEVLNADEIIKSPGVSPAVPIIKRAVDKDIP
ncbi:MAG: UDP-N-acetylmuramoyl-L-alanine--D-glutamate ligase, partial [Candidatus Delongbacteria bacterium]|nr:UDP-N-acetylmuramoyl-L-alanine--D-glutamate ligase [Candidatus Delongbacteria bacterium]